MMFTVYTRPELRRALDLLEENDELTIAFPGGLPDGEYLLETTRVTVRHIPEPPA